MNEDNVKRILSKKTLEWWDANGRHDGDIAMEYVDQPLCNECMADHSKEPVAVFVKWGGWKKTFRAENFEQGEERALAMLETARKTGRLISQNGRFDVLGK